MHNHKPYTSPTTSAEAPVATEAETTTRTVTTKQEQKQQHSAKWNENSSTNFGDA